MYTVGESTSFSVTFGVVSGYSLDDQDRIGVAKHFEKAVSLWQDAMTAEYNDNGYAMVTAVANFSRAVYPAARGCPPEGEFAVTLTGTRNNDDCSSESEYVGALTRIVERVKKELNQRRVTLTVYGTRGVRRLYFED